MLKDKLYYIVFLILLSGFTLYVLLDTFVIGRVYSNNAISDTSYNNESSVDNSNVISNDNYYKDDNIEITLSTIRKYDTTIYIADVIVSDASYLKTAFANNSYGKNITDSTSSIAESNNAIIAINGDYYGVQTKGYVLKNYKSYRSTANSNKEDLIIYGDGTFDIINESDVTMEELLNKNVKEVLSFGPALIYNCEISVSENDEVGKAMASNPRTAIGIIDDLHYVLVVSDGRTSESEGLSLYELADVMKDYNLKILYNLDGGGSSTMYFNGKVINNPTTSGNRIKERSVSDIVYIG